MTDGIWKSLMISAFMLSSLITIFPASSNSAAIYTDNPCQQILADPVRPIIYIADTGGEYVHFMDSSTGGEIVSVWVGLDPTSLDMSIDGSELYVAISSDNRIAVIDVATHTLARNISLSFPPLSVSVAQGNRIFASTAQEFGGTIYIIDGTNGRELDSYQLQGSNVIVEANPAGTIVLSVTPYTGTWVLDKYTVSRDRLNYDSQFIDWNVVDFRQMALDWTGGFVYIVGVSPHKVYKVSVDTMTLDSTYDTGPNPSGIALTADRGLAYVVCTDYWYPGEIWIHNTTTGSCVYNASGSPGTGIAAALSSDEASLWIRSPLTRIPIRPAMTPVYPAPSSVFTCTPSHVEATGATGLPAPQPDNISFTLDGVSLDPTLTIASVYSGSVRANLTSRLGDGLHSISLRMTWSGSDTWCNWSFVIDRASPTAQRPSVTPLDPAPWTSIDYYPDTITATVFYGIPRIVMSNATMAVDGRLLDSFLSDDGIFTGYANRTVLVGNHTVTATIYWAGTAENATVSWNFMIVQVPPRIQYLNPGPGSTIPPGYIYISAMADRGSPEVTLIEASITLDGLPVATSFELFVNYSGLYEYIIYSNTTEQVLQVYEGNHTVELSFRWNGGEANASWQFRAEATIPPIVNVTMIPYTYKDEFTMKIPQDWELHEDYLAGGTTFKVALFGPTNSSIRTNVLIRGENDSSVRETDAFLYHMMNETIDGVRSSGYYVILTGEPTIVRKLNYTDIVFEIDYTTSNMKQLISIMVNETMKRFWVFVGTSSADSYQDMRSVFTTMVSSFDLLEWQSGKTGSAQFHFGPWLGLLLAAVIGGLGGLLVWASRRNRPEIGQAPRQGQAASATVSAGPGGAICQSCGEEIPPGGAFCPSCGATLSLGKRGG